MARIKGVISQEILKKLLAKKEIVINKQSPRFWIEVYRQLFGGKPLKERVVKDAFYYLKKKNLLVGQLKEDYFSIQLTSAGKVEAAKCQIDWLEIRRPKRWDKEWRLVILDILGNQRLKETIRKKLKKLGFHFFQKDVCIIPFPCRKEIGALRSFFGLAAENLKLFESANLEQDLFLREVFKLEEKTEKEQQKS
ncbi:MAG: hypothetical protein Q8N16_02990 [bacterium]|nr:hypothetical protein [bacterium]